MLPEFFKFSLPTRMIYGDGITERLHSELSLIPAGKALVLSDAVLEKLGHVEKLKNGLKGSQIEVGAVFTDIPPDSTITTVEKAAAAGTEAGCTIIIAIGGGSVMDTAKVVNVLMKKGGKIQDHMGAQLITEPLYPSVFIPTTSGTGSEATQFAMISDPDNDVKLPFAEEFFLPNYAVLDPRMTVGMPPKLTAATGMDALTHAIESYVSKEANPVSDSMALAAIELISQNLLQATAAGDDIEARGNMLVASFLAAMAFNYAGVGIVHGVSHSLGGIYHIPHGVANSIILPLGMEYNLESATHRYARICEAMGEMPLQPIHEISRRVARFDLPPVNQALDQLGFVDNWLMKQRAALAVEKVRRLNQQLSSLSGFPTNLRDAGIKDGLKRMSDLRQKAMEDGSMLFNPESVNADAVEAIIRQAHDQNLPPIKVSLAERRAAKPKVLKKKITGVYKDAGELYEILVGFFEQIRNTPSMAEDLASSKLSVRFNYRNPESSIAIDASGDEVRILQGEEAERISPEVDMTMEADFAHYFWHGQVNLVQALARREVVTKGNLPKALKLLPILEPAYDMYPRFLREHNKAELVVV